MINGDEGAVAPEVGDEVEVMVKGRVEAADGGMLVVKALSANDVPLKDQPKAKEKSLDEEREDMEREAEQFDQNYML